MLDKFVGSTDILKLAEPNLSDDSTEFSSRSGNTVRGRAVSCRENFARYHKRGGVWAKILEEIGKAIQEDECFGVGGGRGELVITET